MGGGGEWEGDEGREGERAEEGIHGVAVGLWGYFLRRRGRTGVMEV